MNKAVTIHARNLYETRMFAKLIAVDARVLTVPEVVACRLNSPIGARSPWNIEYMTSTIELIGKSAGGADIVAVLHPTTAMRSPLLVQPLERSVFLDLIAGSKGDIEVFDRKKPGSVEPWRSFEEFAVAILSDGHLCARLGGVPLAERYIKCVGASFDPVAPSADVLLEWDFDPAFDVAVPIGLGGVQERKTDCAKLLPHQSTNLNYFNIALTSGEGAVDAIGDARQQPRFPRRENMREVSGCVAIIVNRLKFGSSSNPDPVGHEMTSVGICGGETFCYRYDTGYIRRPGDTRTVEVPAGRKLLDVVKLPPFGVWDNINAVELIDVNPGPDGGKIVDFRFGSIEHKDYIAANRARNAQFANGVSQALSAGGLV
jgi:hypothetical protein